MLASLVLALLSADWPPSSPDVSAEALSSPSRMPDDPEYAPRPDPTLGCAGQLELYSFTPACLAALSADERPLGSGVHADRAWAWTLGDPRVTVAIVGDGASWSDPELVAHWRLSAGELDPPDVPRTSTGAASHDTNGDGAFTVLDYTSASATTAPAVATIRDRRLLARDDKGDVNGNGLLDPGDLILLFSDGSDADANGLVDDIAGWDLVDGDNDPGAPEIDPLARAAVATANNGLGGAGVCPRCTLLALRASTRGLAAGDELGAAVVLAVDGGAQVVAVAAASLGGGNFLRAALDYAALQGALPIAHAGAGGAERLELPLPPDQTLFASTLGWDTLDRREAGTGFALDACSNSLPPATLGVPGRCAAAPLGVLAGAAGLLYSAAAGIPARNVPPLNPALDPVEARLLLAGSAQLAPAAASTGGALSAEPSSAPRLQLRRALDALIERRLPVEVEILTPEWGAMQDPTPETGFLVRARVHNRRHPRAAWVLELAPGRSPGPLAFSPLASGTVALGEAAEPSAIVPTAALFRDPTAPPSAEGDYELTLRLSATAELGGAPVRSETRRIVREHRDLELFPAFPLSLGGSAVGAPRLADLDGDGRDEVLVAGDEGRLHAFDARGRELPGFPARAPAWPRLDPSLPGGYGGGRAYTSGALSADVPEPFVSDVVLGDGAAPLIAALTADGSLLFLGAGGAALGAPVSLGARATAPHALALAQLGGDGTQQAVVITEDGRLHVVRPGGAPQAGFPVLLPEPALALAVGDLDGDGAPELVLAGETRLMARHADGTEVAGFPVLLPGAPGQEISGLAAAAARALALGDVDGDGRVEIVLAAAGLPLRVYGGDGAERAEMAGARERFGARSDAPRTGPPLVARGGVLALGDLDGDGRLDACATLTTEAALAQTPGAEPEELIGAWTVESGAFLDGMPRVLFDPGLTSAAIADLDGDGRPELILGRGPDRVEAFSIDGTRPRSWPKLVSGFLVGAPALGDLDGDGMLDVVAVTRTGELFAWRMAAPLSSLAPWPTAGHDRRGTHNAETPVAVLRKTALESGCGCSTAQGAAPEAALLAGLLLGLGRVASRTGRRRRDPGVDRGPGDSGSNGVC